jgi:two-component system cell cycle sensor histidine kinase/response regulator CckA
MSRRESSLPRDADEEVSALIETLHHTEQRLEELTSGEVDTVTDGEGRTFLLRRAQEQLRHSEAARQAAILNALPAHIALLDTQGRVISVNEAWRQFAGANGIQVLEHGMGLNYLEICDGARGDRSTDASRVAQGIRSVLGGWKKAFSIVYPCHSPTEQRWFLMTVTPLSNDRPNGAVVMHQNVTAEIQTEERLRASELRFRQMAGSIRDVFFLRDLESSHFHYVSPAYEQIWGRTCESLYSNPASWSDAIHPDDLDYVLTQLRESRDAGFDYEFRIVRPDGETRWVHSRGFTILDDQGTPYRTAGIDSDITERKRVFEKLRESERRFSDVLANVEMVSVMLDTNARITYCNDYLLRLTGWQREDVIGRDWFDLFIAPGRDDLRVVFSELLAGRPSARHHENEILTRSGGTRLIQWNNTVLRSPAGEVTGTAGIGVDISERKQAEARLRLQSVALNASATAMLITESDGTIVWINPAYTQLTGYSDEEAVGRNQRDLVRSGMQDGTFYKEMWDTLLAGESWKGEVTNRRKDGRLYVESQTITPVKGDDDAISHFISINTDLTAQHQMEAQLRQAQKMEAVGQLAAGVAHEFNNLLQALMSMAAIMRLRAVTSEIADLGTEMESQIKRGAGITQQLLLFSRSRAIEKTDLDLRDQVQKASVLLQRLIPETIRIVVETSSARLPVEGDAGQMQQVLLNLAINARDAMPGGGILTLRAGRCGGETFLEVEDTGHGVDQSTIGHMFEPFFTTKGVGKGSGLGLAVVHGIVEQHGGRIEVESIPGQGSRFRVILPTGLFADLPAPEPRADAEVAASSGHVLLVEDEGVVRTGIALLLEMIGYEVITTGSGEEAIAIQLEDAPDLLLSDVTLPGIAGFELGERLQQRWPSLKVVLMSGYIDEALRASAIERGWHFLQKPFEMSQLASHLREALDGRMPGVMSS